MRILVETTPAQLHGRPPAEGEVRVWVVPLDSPRDEPSDLLASLTPDERDRAERYRSAPVRHQFVTGRAILRRILGACLQMRPHEVPITYTAAGKPVLVATELAATDPSNPGPAAVRAGGHLCYASANRAVTALGHLYRYARFRERHP